MSGVSDRAKASSVAMKTPLLTAQFADHFDTDARAAAAAKAAADAQADIEAASAQPTPISSMRQLQNLVDSSHLPSASHSRMPSGSPVGSPRSQSPFGRASPFVPVVRETDWVLFSLALRLGALMLLLFWVLWDCVIDTKLRSGGTGFWVDAVLPVYRATGFLIFGYWMWGVCVYIWHKVRVSR
jgi:hypothetical protein